MSAETKTRARPAALDPDAGRRGADRRADGARRPKARSASSCRRRAAAARASLIRSIMSPRAKPFDEKIETPGGAFYIDGALGPLSDRHRRWTGWRTISPPASSSKIPTPRAPAAAARASRSEARRETGIREISGDTWMAEFNDRTCGDGDKVETDGNVFNDCRFQGASLVYAGGPHPQFDFCNLENSGWYFKDGAPAHHPVPADHQRFAGRQGVRRRSVPARPDARPNKRLSIAPAPVHADPVGENGHAAGTGADHPHPGRPGARRCSPMTASPSARPAASSSAIPMRSTWYRRTSTSRASGSGSAIVSAIAPPRRSPHRRLPAPGP